MRLCCFLARLCFEAPSERPLRVASSFNGNSVWQERVRTMLGPNSLSSSRFLSSSQRMHRYLRGELVKRQRSEEVLVEPAACYLPVN